MTNLRRKQTSGRKRLSGATFVELMVASAIFTLISAFSAFLIVEMARQARTSSVFVPNSGDSHRMMDRVRQEILGGEMMKTVVYDDKSGISYRLPSRPGASAIWLDDKVLPDGTRNLIFQEVSSKANVIWGQVNNFVLERTDVKTVKVELQMPTINRNNEQIPMTYVDTITLRN